MHKRGFVVRLAAFHLADKAQDDLRCLKIELQGTEYGVFQQMVERSLPITGKKTSEENLVTHSQVFPFAKGNLVGKAIIIKTSTGGKSLRIVSNLLTEGFSFPNNALNSSYIIYSV